MKFISALLALSFLLITVDAECTDYMEHPIDEATKLAFAGYVPSVTRIANTGGGNKVVFRGYSREPLVKKVGETISVTAGEPCDGSDFDLPESPGNDESVTLTRNEEGQEALKEDQDEIFFSSSAVKSFLGLSVPLFFGRSMGTSSGVGSALITTLALTSSSAPWAHAQDTTISECDSVPIEVNIYVDTTANDIVMMESQSGDYEICPPETLYWKHHPKVFGGYEGCVGEKGYYPCAQDSQGLGDEDGALQAMYPLKWTGTACAETGYTTENRTYWILWGDPLDKHELNSRTGLNPVVSFPFNRGPYPRYEQGVDLDDTIDDSADARAAAKDLLVYIGAFTEEELDDYDVTFTEGAESGMTHIWAGKALEIAQSTCNRDIFALMEVPAYGYSPSDAAAIVNKFSDSFLNSTVCACFETDSCKDPTVTISNRGWLPLTPFPVETGGDGLSYAADSASASSPWFESMVFPENPTGKIKTPQLSAERRVCDGVYVWPMYFGMRDYMIPIEERPDCSAWSFSITKAYSASVRAGFVLYKRESVANKAAMVDTISDSYSMTHGLYSEWSWYGQMQLWEMIMSKPISDPTSWIGAYSEIMEEKWSLMIDAFADCPVLTLANPRAGAYAWFVYNEPYVGIQDGFVSSFFRDVLGVRTTTYNWGFRGADPADYYGANYTTADFTRLQLYRDVSVYEEVARRAKMVCADLDASIGEFVSINDWVAASQETNERQLTEGDNWSKEGHKRHLREALPHLNDRQLEVLADNHEMGEEMDKKANLCAPDFTTTCFFKNVGTRFSDF